MLTGVKDTDLLILSELDDKSLFSLCLTNKKLNNLCKDENFWKKRAYIKFSDIKKKEDETWRNFYLRRIYEESTLLGKLEEIVWTKADFNYGIPVGEGSHWFHDSIDNWLIYYDKKYYGITDSKQLIYISSEQENKERIRIEMIEHLGQKQIFIYIQFEDRNYATGNVDERIENFLKKKGKLHWFNRDENSIKEFEKEMTEKIPKILKDTNLLFSEYQKESIGSYNYFKMPNGEENKEEENVKEENGEEEDEEEENED